MSPGLIMAFVAACAAGGLARQLVTELVQQRLPGPFPWPTFVVNVSGAFLAGLILGGIDHHAWVLALVIGFCGCYTTISSFGLQTAQLFWDGRSGLALTNVAASLGFSLFAAAIGLTAGGLVA